MFHFKINHFNSKVYFIAEGIDTVAYAIALNATDNRPVTGGVLIKQIHFYTYQFYFSKSKSILYYPFIL